jgi:foldase protein PrsA
MENKKANESKNRSLIVTILVAVIVVLVIGSIAGYAIYRQEIEPFETVVLRIDDKEIKMRYFLKRLRISQYTPSFEGPPSLLSMIAQEEIIKKKTSKPPYNLSATEDEVVDFLKTIARQGGGSITEKEYSEWYRQQLNQTQFSELEFRELARMNVLRQKLRKYLAIRAPTVAEQVHLHMIIQRTGEEINKVKQRLDEGEDFFKLAGELNPSDSTRKSRGDMGWQTKNSLNPILQQFAFQLEVGKSSRPIPLSKEAFAIVMVNEKSAAKELSEELKRAQELKLVERWAFKEFQFHKISYHGLKEGRGWDSETNAWANWQMQRMNTEQKNGK